MTLPTQLFNAILSMDAYSRGYNAAINTLSSNTDGSVQIGNATILTTSSFLEDNDGNDSIDEDIGFYALAYDLDGDGDADTIAYRGTDYPKEGQTTLGIPNDIYHGWTLGAGDLSSEQGEMAVKFYQEVVGAGNYFTSDVTLTGHSLGGGLSGFVGALYDKDTYIYDSMTYALAAARVTNYTVEYQDANGDTHSVNVAPDIFSNFSSHYPGSTILNWQYQNPEYVDLVYGGNTPVDPDYSGMKGYYVAGEILGDMGRYDDADYTNPNAEITVLNNIDLISDDDSYGYAAYFLTQSQLLAHVVNGTVNAVAESIARHSQSTLIITMFKDEVPDYTDWDMATQYFWPVLYDADFAGRIGMTNDLVSGELQDNNQYADILRMIIAYSAIEHEVDGQGQVVSQSVFGDTGIRALYDDANDNFYDTERKAA